jgi:hypothetical protein
MRSEATEMNTTARVFINGLYAGMLTGAMNVHTDTFRLMLLSADYKFDATAHTRRSDLTAYEVSGPGYAGPVEAKVELHYADNGLHLTFAGYRWPRVDIRPRFGAYYRDSGMDDPSQDHLMIIVDFGRTIEAKDGALLVAPNVLELVNNEQSK